MQLNTLKHRLVIMMMKSPISFIFLALFINYSTAQNSMVGDGFGGRLWYSPTNYTVGSYSAYSVCYEQCEDSPNQLYGWGNNGSNQLGLGFSIGGVNIPTPIPNMTNVKFYSTGYDMGAIKKDRANASKIIKKTLKNNIYFNKKYVYLVDYQLFINIFYENEFKDYFQFHTG